MDNSPYITPTLKEIKVHSGCIICLSPGTQGCASNEGYTEDNLDW